MNDSNSEILTQIRNGNQKAFEKIFNEYYRRLFYYAREYVIDVEIAREFVQEAFLKLWENRATLNERTNFEAFLFTILRNDCLNYLKQVAVKKRYNKFSQQTIFELQLNYEALKDKTSELLFFEELRKEIDNAIEELPPKCREIFMMSRYNEMKYKEIAVKLKISVKTVENQISEALKRLRQTIKKYF